MSNGWYAFDIVGESIDRTLHLLFKPLKVSFWLKLAFVVFLMNGGLNSLSNMEFYQFDRGYADVAQNLTLVIAVAAIMIAFALFFAFVGSVAVFIFIDAVLQKRVAFFEGFHKNIAGGFKLFLFNIMLTLIALAILIALLLPAAGIYLGLSGGVKYAALFGYFIFAFAVLCVAVIALVLVRMFTTDFVAALMYRSGSDVIASWKRLLPIMRKNMEQFVMYVLARVILGIVTGIATLIVVIASFLILLAVAVVVGFGLGAVGAIVASPSSVEGFVGSPPVLIILGVALLIATSIIAYVMTVVMLPITVFYRYYSLIFLGRVHPEAGFFAGEQSNEPEKESKPEKDLYVEVG